MIVVGSLLSHNRDSARVVLSWLDIEMAFLPRLLTDETDAELSSCSVPLGQK